MARKIIGTEKFIVYLYTSANVRGNNPQKPNHFVYRQWGRVFKSNENGKPIDNGYPFKNFGEMIIIMNETMRKTVMRNLKQRGCWK